MDFLGRKPSHEFTRFIRVQERELGVAITFCTMEQHPIDHYQKNLLGTWGRPGSERILTVYVNVALIKREGFPSEAKEVTAAHEVLHLWAEHSGFPITKHSNEFKDDGPEVYVGGMLHSLVQHIPIDQKMREEGFDPYVVLRKDGMDALHRWGSDDFVGIDPDKPQFVIETLNYIKSQLRYPEDLKGAARRLFEDRFPEIISLGHKGLAIIGECDCMEPREALDALILLRDVLGLKDHGVLVCDSVSGKIY